MFKIEKEEDKVDLGTLLEKTENRQGRMLIPGTLCIIMQKQK
jgi:hypothetical protein